MRLDRTGSSVTTDDNNDQQHHATTHDHHGDDGHAQSERSSTSESNSNSPLATQQQQQQCKHEVPPAATIAAGGDDDADHHTIVDMTLRTTRYIIVLAIGLGFALAYAIFSFEGMELRSRVYEAEGTSKRSDAFVEQFSSISGPIMFAISKILEFYLETLVFPTLVTYLHNCRLYPGDQPQRMASRTKSSVLYWAFKSLFILLNVGLASLYVSQLAAGVDHIMTIHDLTTNATGHAAVGGSSNSSDVTNTLLRSVVSGYVAPFTLHTTCGAINQTSPRPRVEQVASTSLSLAFPLNDWNRKLLPNGLPSASKTSSLSFTYGDYRADPAKFAALALSTQINVTLAIETFILGASQLERTLSNMDLTQHYDCNALINKTFQPARCNGVQLQLQEVLQLLLPGNTTFPKLITQIADVARNALGQTTTSDALRISFESYAISNELTLETLALDLPLEGKYALDNVEFDTNDRKTPVHFLDSDECGASQCVYKSFNTKALVRSEVLLTPFFAHCEQGRWRDAALNVYGPRCSVVPQAVMTYGVGSYITADALALSSDKKRRKLVNPQTFLSLAFGKLSWTFRELHDAFDGTQCIDSDNCRGLALPLLDATTNTSNSVLLVGEHALPTAFLTNTVLRPLRLVSLNSVFVPLLQETEGRNEFAMQMISSTNLREPVAMEVFRKDGPACDSLMDSYIQHVEANRFYMDKPHQTMYTAALYYLLQNGVATSYIRATDDANSIQRLDLTLAMEVKAITFSVSLASALATFIGCSAMLLLALALILLPTARVKQRSDTTPAAQYVQILTDRDAYPNLIHKKRLRFDNGDALLMNEYVVDHIVLHAKRDPTKKIYL